MKEVLKTLKIIIRQLLFFLALTAVSDVLYIADSIYTSHHQGNANNKSDDDRALFILSFGKYLSTSSYILYQLSDWGAKYLHDSIANEPPASRIKTESRNIPDSDEMDGQDDEQSQASVSRSLSNATRS